MEATMVVMILMLSTCIFYNNRDLSHNSLSGGLVDNVLTSLQNPKRNEYLHHLNMNLSSLSVGNVFASLFQIELKDGVTILKDDDVSRELVAQQLVGISSAGSSVIFMNLSLLSGPVGNVFASLQQRKQFDAAQVRELNKGNSSGGISGLSGPVGNVFASLFQNRMNGNLIHSSLSGPVGNVSASLFHNRMYDLPPNAATFIASTASTTSTSDPLIIALCLLLCFLALQQQQQQQPQPPIVQQVQQLPDLDQDEDPEEADAYDDDQDADAAYEDQTGDEEKFIFEKDPRGKLKRERIDKLHWKKRNN